MSLDILEHFLFCHAVCVCVFVKIVDKVVSSVPDAEIIHGDITDQDLLESGDLSQSDAVVTLTGIDEMNMIVSLYAASKGVPKVVTKLSHTSNLNLVGSLSLGSVVSPRDLVCNNIVRYVRAMENQTGAALSVHTIADGQAEALEFLVDEHTHHCGKPLKDIKLKPNILLVSISHGAQTEIPNGNSVFQQGDIVVVVDTNSKEIIRQLNDIFA